MKLALQTYTGENWLGGVTAFRDLLVALRCLGSEAPSTWLVTWEGLPDSEYRAYLPLVDGRIELPYPPDAPARTGWRRQLNNSGRALLGQGRAPLAGKLRAAGVDCAFSVVLGPGKHDPTVPLITWLYDFQFRYLPEMFTPRERDERTEAFRREAAAASLLLVKSDSVQQDVQRFLPEFAAKARRVRWVADIPAAIYEASPRAVLQTYHLPEKFFLLPNQFWMHKNHLTVFKALQRLAGRGLRPVVVCTGSLVDDRRLDYINDLMQSLSLWNLRDQVILLGVIPREHVLLLMRQSLRVINASLFEGFGLSVAECLSLGKGMLLSDLPVLREQAHPACRYFNPRDEADLAGALAEAWEDAAPGPDHALEAAARAALPDRQKEFGRAFVKVAAEAMQLAKA
jgi:glycosyltransferase involved in cell wall biosynthesis